MLEQTPGTEGSRIEWRSHANQANWKKQSGGSLSNLQIQKLQLEVLKHYYKLINLNRFSIFQFTTIIIIIDIQSIPFWASERLYKLAPES